MSAAPKEFGSAVAQVLERLGLGQQLKQYEVLERWGEIVGDQIAAVTTAERIDGGRLYVHVSRSTWRNELVFLKAGIIDKINKAVDEGIVNDIIFR